MNEQHYDNALHMMEKQGGSFVKSLVNCYYMADQANREKLYETFAEYFHGYETRYETYIRRKNEARWAAEASARSATEAA
jgi:hypothetical protein